MLQFFMVTAVLWKIIGISAEICPEDPEIRIWKAYPEANYTVIHPNNTYPSGNVPDQVVYFSEPSNLILQCSSRHPILWDFGLDIKLNQHRYIRPTRTAEDVFNITSYCFRINLFLYRLNNATGKYTCRMLNEQKNTSFFLYMQNHESQAFINAGAAKVISKPRIIDNWLQVPCITYNPWVPVELYINDSVKIEIESNSLRWNPLEGFWLKINEKPNCTTPCFFTCRAGGNYSGKDNVHILRAETSATPPAIDLKIEGGDFKCSVPPGQHVKELGFKRCSNIMECYNAGKTPLTSSDRHSRDCDSVPSNEVICRKVQPPPIDTNSVTTGMVKCTAGASRYSEDVTVSTYRFYRQPSGLIAILSFEQLQEIFTNGSSWPRFSFHTSSFLSIKTEIRSVYYVGESVTMECRASTFLLAEGIEWVFGLANGEKAGKKQIAFSSTFEIDSIRPEFEMRSTITFRLWSPEVTSINCMGPTWTNYGWINATKNIKVVVGEKPSFVKNGETLQKVFYVGDKNTRISCMADGDPKPTITWTMNGKDLPPGVRMNNSIDENVSSKTEKSVLIFTTVTDSMKGQFTCRASNFAGAESQTYVVDVKGNKGPLIGMIVGATIAILILITVVVFLYRHLILQRKIIDQFLSDKEMEEFFYGMPELVKNKDNVTSEYSQFLPYKKEYEILPTNIEIEKEVVLGSGQYGMVFKGKLVIEEHQRSVAVKTVKPSADKEFVKALLSEIKIMMTIGSHPSVVNFIGALTQDLRDGKLLIVVEFCENGSLEKYLRKYRNNYIDQIQDDVIVVPESELDNSTQCYETCEKKPLDTRTLVTWAYEIASGMEYLATKKVIHADMACRNILVTDHRTVKITDFGLSRQLYESSDYVKKTQVPLPWRWMAIESLKDMNFSIYSDIWSYGVTLWEIFSLGAVPYPGYNWDQDFLKKLESGLRVDKPEFATSQIYTAMLNCMELDPEQRLTFTNVKKFFEGLIQSFNPYHADGYCKI
ncbi:unnamed protein product [Allacma fusca]|uniref:Receptor protein-tyrosine kinase n=1 Tax=Allacma fusca TaxID=39272 RepID=A0A8J2L3Y5_9HEXA|nr:unnamed protein product [Allacma fusca]